MDVHSSQRQQFFSIPTSFENKNFNSFGEQTFMQVKRKSGRQNRHQFESTRNQTIKAQPYVEFPYQGGSNNNTQNFPIQTAASLAELPSHQHVISQQTYQHLRSTNSSGGIYKVNLNKNSAQSPQREYESMSMQTQPHLISIEHNPANIEPFIQRISHLEHKLKKRDRAIHSLKE